MMFTLRRIISNDLIKSHVRNTLFYTTKTNKHVTQKKYQDADPGIGLRKKLLKNTSVDELENIDLEGLESDFMNVHLTHKDYQEELEARREQLKYFIVKEKYFKEKMPNFLTYNDKLQIKYLHNTDPEQWTVERLSEAFPALPDVIKKVLKSNWTKKTVEKMKHHDEAVYQNWEQFKKGRLTDLPSDLTDHLKKFTNRALNQQAYNPTVYETTVHKKIQDKPKIIKTEFSDIITSYEKLNEKPNEATNLIEEPKENNKFSRTSRRRVTLPELKREIETAVQRGKQVTETEMLILKEVQTQDSRHEIMELEENIAAVQKHQQKPAEVASKKRDYSFLDYPMRIKIPQKVHKPGCTYKLNDCYYDDRGIFLYRVPGMDR